MDKFTIDCTCITNKWGNAHIRMYAHMYAEATFKNFSYFEEKFIFKRNLPAFYSLFEIATAANKKPSSLFHFNFC